ncbi:MAG: hypothetical protein SNJ77_08825 [Cytophagales bacterium]
MHKQINEQVFKKYELFLKSNVDNVDLSEVFEVILNSEANVSLRINPNKRTILDFPVQDYVPWSKYGIFLSERPNFAWNPLFHAGAFYVQESHSMLLEHVLSFVDHNHFERVLDLCASPGGKSTHLLSLLSKDCLLVSNEMNKQRNSVLVENLSKWGHENVVVTQNDPAHFTSLDGFFDLILVDAPCSGEGLFRKDPDALNEWSEENVLMCQKRQKRIVEDIWPCVSEGGYLIYSTCTLNTKENEENIQWFKNELNAEVISIPVEASWNMIDTGFGIKCFPGKQYGEGFFISLLKKNSGETFNMHNRKPQLKCPVEELKSKFKSSVDLAFLKQDDFLLAYPQLHHNAFEVMRQKLYVKKLGVTLGQVKNKDFVYGHEFAVSNMINVEDFKVIDIDLENALKFLRKSDLDFELISGKQGLYLLRYQEVNLGFLKCMLNRANNLYPMDWRLRI